MKMILAMLLGAIVAGARAADSDRPNRVVFEFTSEKPDHLTAIVRNVENLRTALGADTRVVVVAHGPGIMLVQKSNELSAMTMRKLADAGVTFAACENTMKRKKIAKSDLLDFSTTVDSGVAEVVRKQAAGWSYVKSSD